MSAIAENWKKIVFVPILLGLVFSGWGIYNLAKAKEAESWPTVQGMVIESYVDSTTNSDGDRSYKPVVVYRYSVNGKQYENDKIFSGSGSVSSTGSWARDIVDKYPVDKNVKVYYNPDDPSESVLEPGTNFTVWVPLLIGLGMLAIAGGVSFYFWYNRYLGADAQSSPNKFTSMSSENHSSQPVDILCKKCYTSNAVTASVCIQCGEKL